MPVLRNSRHELFAEAVAQGVTPVKAYISAGFAKGSAASNAIRLMKKEAVVARIREIKTAIAQGLVDCAIRRRSWRVLQLQGLVDDMLALIAARKRLYRGQFGEPQTRTVTNAEEEQTAIREGFSPAPDSPPQAFPKTMLHPGHPTGGETGLLVKDYRGQNAEQEIWKFDSALVAKLLDAMKQAAIEEGQWAQKREPSDGVGISEIRRRLNAGRDRVAKLKEERDRAAAAKPPAAPASTPVPAAAAAQPPVASPGVLALKALQQAAIKGQLTEGSRQMLNALSDKVAAWEKARAAEAAKAAAGPVQAKPPVAPASTPVPAAAAAQPPGAPANAPVPIVTAPVFPYPAPSAASGSIEHDDVHARDDFSSPHLAETSCGAP